MTCRTIKALILRVSFRFPPTRGDAIISARGMPAALGLGRNGRLNLLRVCCGFVAGGYSAIPRAYQPAATPQREIKDTVYMCARACAGVRISVFMRCGVALYIYLIDIYRKDGATSPQRLVQQALKALRQTLRATSNTLKYNKKGGFSHG